MLRAAIMVFSSVTSSAYAGDAQSKATGFASIPGEQLCPRAAAPAQGTVAIQKGAMAQTYSPRSHSGTWLFLPDHDTRGMAPATPQVSTRTPPAVSAALFLCHTQQGIDQSCTAALANALVIEQSKRDATTTADRSCHTSPRTFPERPGTRP